MAHEQAWIRAETGGTKQASLITNPAVLAALIRKAEHPVVIAGHLVVQPGKVGDTLTRFIRDLGGLKIPVVSTAHTYRELKERGITPVASMGVMEIIQRLCDPEWKGINGTGPHDLILLTGLSYSLCSVLLSGLKQGARNSKTVTLDPKYHPNASWSMPNRKEDAWEELLSAVVCALAESGKGEVSDV